TAAGRGIRPAASRSPSPGQHLPGVGRDKVNLVMSEVVEHGIVQDRRGLLRSQVGQAGVGGGEDAGQLDPERLTGGFEVGRHHRPRKTASGSRITPRVALVSTTNPPCSWTTNVYPPASATAVMRCITWPGSPAVRYVWPIRRAVAGLVCGSVLIPAILYST